ncbi:hypothetical protein M153_2100030559 [Pseudoloma neurophilia]|uniref:Uncharacterized protein n=1 Tax=Pseudoloma neurophilia TaxID=146866 RepID=A0A0R0M1B9_9MICR|nr:hypothetical protein M153_2100030559 [Pseudoloma neurophilia]
MPLNIRKLKESIGIHLLFLLALTSAFLGVYITIYDLVGHDKGEKDPKYDEIPFDFSRNSIFSNIDEFEQNGLNMRHPSMAHTPILNSQDGKNAPYLFEISDLATAMNRLNNFATRVNSERARVLQMIFLKPKIQQEKKTEVPVRKRTVRS